MISFPPCKINLGLNIIAKRSDGYHNIETCFYPVPWTDILEIIPSHEVTFTASGIPIPGNENDNLCLKAYWLLQQDFNLSPVSIHLHKVLPTGAGLGGGSSDAAHTLRLLNTIFKLTLSITQLRHYAAKLGSDCAFFCEDVPMLGSGRGEILEPAELSLKGKFIVLVNPGLHVSTAQAYSGVIPTQPAQKIKDVLRLPVKEWKSLVVNDFEKSVFEVHPKIKELKQMLYQEGALFACMSGSGSTVFGIFESPVDLRHQFNTMMYWSGTLK